MAFPYELCLEVSIAPLEKWPSLSGIQVLNAQMIIPSRTVDQNARPTFCFSLGRVWYSLMPRLFSCSPRLLSAEQENSLVNCLYHFGSNHRDVTSTQLECKFQKTLRQPIYSHAIWNAIFDDVKR